MVDLVKTELALHCFIVQFTRPENHILLYMQSGLVGDFFHQSMVGHILPSYYLATRL